MTISTNAAVFTVNTLADNESNTCAIGNCTLREAVSGANGSGGSDVINFQAGLSGTITLTGGALLINGDTSINGSGARTLSVSGNNADRVFVIVGGTVNISGLTVRDGNAVPILLGATLIGDGGGILNTNGGTLNLTDVTLRGNNSTSLGGAIATRAILLVTTTTNINRCTIHGNTSTLGGGGVSNIGTTILSSAVTTIMNSTVTSNSALAEGGGISNVAGTLNLTNDTISHNSSVAAGGGLVNVLGILIGTVNVRNTILAQNTALIGVDLVSSDGMGSCNTLGHNLVGNNLDIDASFSASVFVGAVPQPNVNADIVGSLSITQIVNPFLGPLQNNGGPTDTRALSIAIGSPAINAGLNCIVTNTCGSNPGGANPSTALTTDQRGTGFSRMSNGSVDIGAYEVQLAPTSASVPVSGQVVNAKGTPISGASITLVGPAGTLSLLTNPLGYYTFPEVPVGSTYVISAAKKGRSFEPQLITVNDAMDDVNFIAQ